VRYFGGVKLGVGGLIEAYREAGRDAVSNAGIGASVLKTQITISYAPDLTRHVMLAIQNEGADIVAERYTTQSLLDISVRAERADPLQQTLLSIHGVHIVDPSKSQP